jgi:hypothetical protein
VVILSTGTVFDSMGKLSSDVSISRLNCSQLIFIGSTEYAPWRLAINLMLNYKRLDILVSDVLLLYIGWAKWWPASDMHLLMFIQSMYQLISFILLTSLWSGYRKK